MIRRRVFSLFMGTLAALVGINVILWLSRAATSGEIRVQSESIPLRTRVVVSYVVSAHEEAFFDRAVRTECLASALLFVARGVAENPSVLFLFTTVGSIQTPSQVTRALRTLQNVQVRHIERSVLDVEAHAEAVAKHAADVFVMLSCAARGPYFHSTGRPSVSWISTFTAKLGNGTRALGATISCVGSAHIQSYAMAMDSTALRLVLPLWTPAYILKNDSMSMDWLTSNALLRAGFNIGSTDSRYSNRDFRIGGVCDPRHRGLKGGRLDPTMCKERVGAGCVGVEPCETVFVKYGDQSARYKKYRPQPTMSRVAQEDKSLSSYFSPSMCSRPAYFPLTEFWDVEAIARKELRAPANRGNFRRDGHSRLAIIVRAHGDYSTQLVSMLFLLASLIPQYKIRVIVVPTERGSSETLRNVLEDFYSKSQADRTQISLLTVSSEVFDRYGHALEGLCTRVWKQMMLAKGFDEWVIDHRYCAVNSPLHYLIVDMALSYIKNFCATCLQVVVTNADNSYSPLFFKYTAEAVKYDIAMVNMVSRGIAFNTTAAIGNVDLGAYAVSVGFLRRTGLSFLESLPARAEPQDFHDADGHFLTAMMRRGATMNKSQEFLFFHN